MFVRLTASPVVAAAMLFLGACAAKVDGDGGTPAGQTVAVDVTPDSVELIERQGTQFASLVTGTAITAVTWQIDEAGGGSVDQTGMYTAPAAAGTFHVRAVSAADGSVSAVATVTVTAPASAGSVAITPKTTSVVAGSTIAFSAVLANLSSNATTWRVQEASGCGSVTSVGVYTAPAAAGTCHVVVTSVADPTRSDVATVTVTAAPVITVSVDPATLTLDACTSRTFTAKVSGSTDQGVTWTADGGTVTSAGVYTAPSTPGVYRVVATARASSKATATATVTVREHVLSVTVDPPSASMPPGAPQHFTATVTTTCGTFTTG